MKFLTSVTFSKEKEEREPLWSRQGRSYLPTLSDGTRLVSKEERSFFARLPAALGLDSACQLGGLLEPETGNTATETTNRWSKQFRCLVTNKINQITCP
jgi:hypothetical protein